MKIIYLVRHAKSSWDHPELRDFDRPLNERGKRDAPKMGRRLKEREIVPDLMLSSPANRALTTCKTIAQIIGYDDKAIKTNQGIYHANEDDLINIVRELPDNVNEVMIFGHNPGLTEFANLILKENIANIPTTGVVACRLTIDHWKDFKPGCGKLLFFDFPKKHLRKED